MDKVPEVRRRQRAADAGRYTARLAYRIGMPTSPFRPHTETSW
jgi:hypothetical protein